ncbi:MAG: ATPase, T2SS/T4P/T4SS family [Syntrophotaleaceae bacterium]
MRRSASISPMPALLCVPGPDIIMIGEIRDFETAEIGVKAALTGHSGAVDPAYQRRPEHDQPHAWPWGSNPFWSPRRQPDYGAAPWPASLRLNARRKKISPLYSARCRCFPGRGR